MLDIPGQNAGNMWGIFKSDFKSIEVSLLFLNIMFCKSICPHLSLAATICYLHKKTF